MSVEYMEFGVEDFLKAVECIDYDLAGKLRTATTKKELKYIKIVPTTLVYVHKTDLEIINP